MIGLYNDDLKCVRECNNNYDKILKASREGASLILAIKRIIKELRIVISIEYTKENKKIK